MCFLCDFIKDKRPSLKELDAFKNPYINVFIIKSHLPHIAQMAFRYCPTLIQEIQGEKDTVTPPSSA